MKLIKESTRGSAYVYVLILMLSVLLMLKVTASIASHSMLVSNATYQNANLYHMAKAGIDKGIYHINNIIFTNKTSIHNKVLEDIGQLDFKDMVIFISKEGYYKGSFHFNLKDSLYKKLFKYHANNYILQWLSKTGGNLNFIIDNYRLNVFINYNIARGYYEITSVATNTLTNVSKTFNATAALSGKVYAETITENYIWYNIPNHFARGIYTYANFYEVFNTEVLLYKNSWSYTYPILFNNNEDLYVDISRFYNQGMPVNTVIIHGGVGQLYIYTSDMSKNMFSGIVISQGNIVFKEGHYVVQGNLISGGDIYYDSLHKTQNSDILFYIDFKNKEDKRKLYDSLLLTNYLKNNGYPLNKLSICSKSPVQIEIYKPIRLTVLHINKQA